jgi:hypothetical protein
MVGRALSGPFGSEGFGWRAAAYSARSGAEALGLKLEGLGSAPEAPI